jgi:hypothetical protein
MSLEEGLYAEMDFMKHWGFDMMADWNYEDPNILELKQEDIVAAPFEHFCQILEFLKLPIKETAPSSDFPLTVRTNLFYYKGVQKIWGQYRTKAPWIVRHNSFAQDRLRAILDRFSFQNLSNSKASSNGEKPSHYRKGQAGDWVNYFTEGHKDEFKRRYGDLLIKTGYETDYNW